MVSKVIDYRVSRVVILCKDCGQDVGLYPARHKCGIPSSETPPLPSIPKKYLSAEKTGSNIPSNNSDNDYSGESLWGKLRSIRNWKDTSVEDVTDNTQNSKLWNKILALNNNNADDSDNESEKDEWEGETHISRILREYYENKGADLPDWLYDLDSKTSVSSTQMNSDSNKAANNDSNYKKSNDNIKRGRQPIIYDSRDLLTSPTSINYPSSPTSMNYPSSPTSMNYPSPTSMNYPSPTSMNYPSSPVNKGGERSRDRSRGRSGDRSRDRNVHPPNSYNDQYRNNNPKKTDLSYNDRSINNTLPPRPSPNVRSTSDDGGRLMHKKSHQQLRTGVHNPPQIPANRSRSVSPNPPRSHQHQQFIPHDVRRFNHNIRQFEGDNRNRQGALLTGPRGPDRINRQGDFF
ncbi:unnamed protein product [Rhizophagus irregularis]|uniref:Mso1 N-terminal domain-containing protein n=1 Tax=Rhizophagus irregularis TaxID=588596 RepID=A0A2I1G7P7_9GLOM|nr:hypothetical protein RhiirA4_94029 [Rhizophagus irregularis]CAB4423641.1 unnamed protein product [Rhizophagus irregularis]